jgi:hypothetical protein
MWLWLWPRRRWKGKSQIWDSKIWSRVLRDSDLRKTALARPSTYTKDTPDLTSEMEPHRKQNRNCQTVINIWTLTPDGARHKDLLTDWPSVAMWIWLDTSENGICKTATNPKPEIINPEGGSWKFCRNVGKCSTFYTYAITSWSLREFHRVSEKCRFCMLDACLGALWPRRWRQKVTQKYQ